MKTAALFGVLTKAMRSPIITHLVDSLHLQLLPPKYLEKSSEEALPQIDDQLNLDAHGDTAQESAEKTENSDKAGSGGAAETGTHPILDFI